MSCDGLGHVDLPEFDPDLADPEPGATPVPAPGSGSVPGTPYPGSGPVPTPVPDPGSAPVPAGSGTELELVPDLVSLPGRPPLKEVARRWARQRVGRMLAIPRKVKTYQPRTWRDHHEYMGAREWMGWASDPRYSYLEGWLRTFIYRTSKWGGIVYGHTLGKAFILAGMWLQEMGHRQSRFWLTVAAFTVLVGAWKLQHILFA